MTLEWDASEYEAVSAPQTSWGANLLEVFLERRGLRDTVPLGAVLPLERGSGGKVLLAWAEDGERFSRVSAVELEEIRQRRWAESVAERESGVASVSAPIFDSDGRLRAAVCASGPSSRLGEHPGERLAKPVAAAAREIEAALGP